MSKADLPTGIQKTEYGYRTFQWVPDPSNPKGRIKTKRWKPDATTKEMVQWREERRAEARKPVHVEEQPVVLTGFAADVDIYLKTVRAMPSIKNRTRDMAEWVAIFGDKPSLEITSQPIRAARDQWLTVGPKRVMVKTKGEKARWISYVIPLSASAINHRLRGLENFFTVMYPKADNPVREVDEVEGPEPEARGQSFAVALEILSFMPDVTTSKKGVTREAGSLSRVRFEAMLWTGLPAIQLGRLKPEMVNWHTRTFLPLRRAKGKKSRRARRRREHPRPLLPQAVAALKRLFALDGNRPFSSTSLGKSVDRAIRAANVVRTRKHLPLIAETLTVYDLTRHTFGTEVFRASKNLKAVQDLLGHADINQSARYAQAAVAEQNVEAIRLLGRHVGRSQRRRGGKVRGKVSPPKLSGRDQPRRKAIPKPH